MDDTSIAGYAGHDIDGQSRDFWGRCSSRVLDRREHYCREHRDNDGHCQNNTRPAAKFAGVFIGSLGILHSLKVRDHTLRLPKDRTAAVDYFRVFTAPEKGSPPKAARNEAA